jgi:DNA polymerase iota
VPSYSSGSNAENITESNVTAFIDCHEIGKIPGIGSKMAHQIRNHVLSRPVEPGENSGWGGVKEPVEVREVRLFPGMGPATLEKILGGPGAERGIGGKVWNLINGVDDTEVQKAKRIPSQISIEDSYAGLKTMPDVIKELRRLATSLIRRMHMDLLTDNDDESGFQKKWIANPKTVRLSTRPRPPPNADGTRTRSFNRISRSYPLPNFVFNLTNEIDYTVERLVEECLIPMFKRLHDPHGGWNLSLINIGVTNMVEAASDDASTGGRDIGKMFKRQEEVLREWRIEDEPTPEEDKFKSPSGDLAAEPSAGSDAAASLMAGSEDAICLTQDEAQGWDDGQAVGERRETCRRCGATMPTFAMNAHERFHSFEE